MRILLFSDSHGYTHNIVRAISKNRDIDMIIHLGDYVKDALKIKDQYKHIETEIVCGNNDWTKEYPSEKLLQIDGKKIFITHGHHYNVKYDYNRLVLKGRAVDADAVFFGHTHLPEELFSENVLLINPGSISAPAQGNSPTYCLVEIREHKISCRFPGFEID